MAKKYVSPYKPRGKMWKSTIERIIKSCEAEVRSLQQQINSNNNSKQPYNEKRYYEVSCLNAITRRRATIRRMKAKLESGNYVDK